MASAFSFDNIISGMAENSRLNNPQKEGDFIGTDGLLMCGVCKEPKETIVSLSPGQLTRCGCMCACGRQEYEKTEAERRKQRHEAAREIAFSGQIGLMNATLANDDGSNPDMKLLAERYVERFDEISKLNNPRGILLWGNCGRGKTHTGCEILNALIDKGFCCRFVRASEAATRANDYQNGTEYINELCRTGILMLDDFGTSKEARSIEKLGEILDLCITNDVTLIVTTNITIEEIKHPQNDVARLYDRLLKLCEPREVKGTNHRRTDARNNYKSMTEILGL